MPRIQNFGFQIQLFGKGFEFDQFVCTNFVKFLLDFITPMG